MVKSVQQQQQQQQQQEHDPPVLQNEPQSKRNKQEWLAFRGTRQSRVGVDYQVTALPTPVRVDPSSLSAVASSSSSAAAAVEVLVDKEDKKQNVPLVEPEPDDPHSPLPVHLTMVEDNHPSHSPSSSSPSPDHTE